MNVSLRGFLLGFLGVAVAVGLSLGAFALAGRSIGEPVRLRIASPSGDPNGARPSSNPKPSTTQTVSESGTPSATDSPTTTASAFDDHGGHGDEAEDDHGGSSNSGPGGGDFDDD